jgi:hypothetical protein
VKVRRVFALVLVLALFAPGAAGGPPIDRAVVRFIALETGGAGAPRFIFERELAFQARLEALAEADFTPSAEEPYRERHVRAALERHIAETILESLSIDPEPTPKELEGRSEWTRVALLHRSGGALAVQVAADAEGIAPSELLRMIRRQARASLYLDRMVAPMLAPSEAELRQAHAVGRTPMSDRPFDEVRKDLEHWYVSRELARALQSFYEGARARLRLHILK